MTSDDKVRYTISAKLSETFNWEKYEYPKHITICINTNCEFKILNGSSEEYLSTKWTYIYSENEGLHLFVNTDGNDVFAFAFPMDKGIHLGHFYNINPNNGILSQIARIYIKSNDKDLPDFSKDLELDNHINNEKYIKMLDFRKERRIALKDYKPVYDITTTFSDSTDDEEDEEDDIKLDKDDRIGKLENRLTNIEDKLDRLLDKLNV